MADGLVDALSGQPADPNAMQPGPGAPTPAPPPDVAPPSMADAMQGQQQQMPNVVGGDNPQMPRQPRLWERVLRGALQGFEMGGIPGAMRGAADPSGASEAMHAEQQSRQSNVRFEDARAANAVAEAGINDAKLHNLPQAIQDEHNKATADVAESYSKLFGPPTMVVNNSGPDAMQALQSQTQQQGAVPHMMYVNTGKQIFGWDLGTAGNSAGAISQINKAGKAMGNPNMSKLTLAQYNMMPKQQKDALMASANKFYNIDAPPKDLRSQEGALSELQTRLNTINALPDGDSDKAELKDVITRQMGLVKSARDAANQAELDQAGKKATIEQHAKGKDMEQLLNYGRDANGNKLDVNNATDEMWVDEKTGKPIPLKLVAQYKPSQNERNRADFAKSTMHVLDTIDSLRDKGKLPDGPLLGNSKQALAKAGFGDFDAQHALDLISLAQSAATGAHVGGKFSNEILDKMKDLISIKMNDSQFQGAEQALRDVMDGYVKSGGRVSVAEYKQMQQEKPVQTSQPGSLQNFINKHKGE